MKRQHSDLAMIITDNLDKVDIFIKSSKVPVDKKWLGLSICYFWYCSGYCC